MNSKLDANLRQIVRTSEKYERLEMNSKRTVRTISLKSGSDRSDNSRQIVRTISLKSAINRSNNSLQIVRTISLKSFE